MSKKKKIIFSVIAVIILIISLGLRLGADTIKKFLNPTNIETRQKEEETYEELQKSDNDLISKIEDGSVTIEKSSLEELLASADESAAVLIPDSEDLNNPNEQTKEEALTDEPVKLLDLYAVEGSEAVFQCFDKDAVSYKWEYYDLDNKTWTDAKESSIQNMEDELHRDISVMKVKASVQHDELMVRCTIQYEDKEDTAQTASLFVISKKIKDIEADDHITDAYTYLNTLSLPIKVIYEDGSKETLTGLSGLYFLSTEENTAYSVSVSGNRVETTTKILTECQYVKIGLEEKELQLRYHPFDQNDFLETTIKVSGKDLNAPVISSVDISPYEVSNVDKAMTLTINIAAEDNETPYPHLEYAFALSGTKLSETDWRRKASFDVEIEKNGTYAAFVRDQAGNISKMEQDIITVDTKAPEISSISLLHNDGWCKSNTIITDVKDSGNISYRFICKADGTDSDWITFCEYTAEKNGTWVVQAKDQAGNISEEEIIINNIDQEAPVIRSIMIKE